MPSPSIYRMNKAQTKSSKMSHSNTKPKHTRQQPQPSITHKTKKTLATSNHPTLSPIHSNSCNISTKSTSLTYGNFIPKGMPSTNDVMKFKGSSYFNNKSTLTHHSSTITPHFTSTRSVSFHPPSQPEEGEIYKSIIEKINKGIPKIAYFELLNESAFHSGPPNRESHFKITVIAPFITELNLKMLVSRHRFINKLLEEEIKEGGVHALSLHLFTAEEFEKRGESIPNSPGCTSKSKVSAKPDDI